MVADLPERRPEQEKEASAQAGVSFVAARDELAEALVHEGIDISADRLDDAMADYLDLREKLMLIRAAVRATANE